MGCYPSNILSNDLPENNYIVNTNLSSGGGNHWNVIARKMASIIIEIFINNRSLRSPEKLKLFETKL